MMQPPQTSTLAYVEERDNGYWLTDSRVSLESVIWAFKDGLSPETIAGECFPTLSLAQVYGAITYYLSHRTEVEIYLRQAERDFATWQTAHHDADFSTKLAQARRHQEASVA